MVKHATLKYFVIIYLNEENRPCYLSDIYKALSKKLKRECNNSFKAHIRGILNLSIVKKERIFSRVPGADKGVYVIDNQENNFEKYLNNVTPIDAKDKGDVVTTDEALKIYEKHTNYAYSFANKMHGTSCIVPLNELQSAGRIGLYKGACKFVPEKSNNPDRSPIPFLRRCIRGTILNTIREQKLWNKRNSRVGENINNSLNVSDIEDVVDDSADFTDDISTSELRDLLLREMREHLNDSEFQILSMRWGLDGEGEKTFKVVGSEARERENKEYNVDSAKSWSWQMEKKARKKLSKRSTVLKKLYECCYA